MSTLAGECGLKFAAAASNSGLPGAGIAHRSKSASDSSAGIALPKANRNCSAVSETARCLLAGFLKTGSVALSADSGSGQHALDLGGVDGDRGGREVLAEQPLRDHAAEGVPDQDRLVRQRGDDLGVVRDDVVDAVVGDGVRVRAGLLDGVGVAGPARAPRRRTRPAVKCSTQASQDRACSQRPWMNRTGALAVMAGPLQDRR